MKSFFMRLCCASKHSQSHIATNNVIESQPWYTLQRKIAQCLGNDDKVAVGELESHNDETYICKITVSGTDKAVGIATIMQHVITFGNIRVKIIILQKETGQRVSAVVPDDINKLKTMVDLALASNNYYCGSVVQNITPCTLAVYAVFTSSLIQVYADNIGDLYGNFNGVVGNVFAEFLDMNIADQYTITASTYNNAVLTSPFEAFGGFDKNEFNTKTKFLD
eukprot:377777_1